MLQCAGTFKAIDLFAGAGGLSEGLRQAGFEVLVASDINPDCTKTYKTNHPETHFITEDIRNVSSQDIMQLAGVSPGELDLVAGGPPCQGFSQIGKRMLDDPRNQLFKEFRRIVADLKPRFFIMENVTGLLSLGSTVTDIYLAFEEVGYRVSHQVLIATEYGVPQERKRVLFVGTRDPHLKPVFPEPTHTNQVNLFTLGQGLRPLVTIAEALSDLPRIPSGGGTEISEYTIEPLTDIQQEMREDSSVVYNHVAPTLGANNLERISHLKPGQNWTNLPRELLPESMKRARLCDHTKRYGRMRPDGQACTLLTKFNDPKWGQYVHYDQDRALTAREGARLQTFPDRYRFCGTRTSQYVQVGNAVPVRLAKAIGQRIITELMVGRQAEVIIRETVLAGD